MKKILIADDERDLCEILEFNLSPEYDVTTIFSAEEALKINNLATFDLFMLDVMMGEMSGFKLAHKLRNEFSLDTPIIFLTAKNSENDLLTGFSIGADDYISKPFSIKEVTARIKAILKRGKSNNAQSPKATLNFDALSIDTTDKKVSISGEEIKLTKTEYKILCLLTQKEGHLFSREEILKEVWKDEAYITERTVDVHITRLRKKIGNYGKYITSRVGYGYKFEIKD